MRFNNNDYLKAFPREDKPAPEKKQPERPGDVLEDDKEELKKDPAPEEPNADPEDLEDEGGV